MLTRAGYRCSYEFLSAREKAAHVFRRASGLVESVVGSASRERLWQLETNQEGFRYPYEFAEHGAEEVYKTCKALREKIGGTWGALSIHRVPH